MIRRFGADLRITAAPNPDANLDGQVNILDLITVAGSLGEQPPSNPQADANKDGVVNILDLVFVAEHLGQNAAAPAQMEFIKSVPSTFKEIIAAHRALRELEAMPNKSQGVQPRHSTPPTLPIHRRPERQRYQTPAQLPQPLQPRTRGFRISYPEVSTVNVKIYDVTGSLVRTINVGHKPTGYYLTHEKAVYWDGA